MSQSMFEEAYVNVGEISMKTLANWANGIPRFVEVTADTLMREKVFEEWAKRVRNQGMLERHIKFMDKELIQEATKNNFLVLFARDVVQAIFNGKTLEEAIQETINNDKWIEKTVERAIQMNANSAVQASMVTSLMCMFDGSFDDDDDGDGEDTADAKKT